MTTRRNIIAGALIFASLAISPAHAQAQDKPVEIRIGTQKGGLFPAVRQRRSVEDAFKPLGIEVKWIDFQFGPPLLEAINVGSVDFGFVGDAPPIFAQAGGARICATSQPSGRRAGTRRSSAPEDSAHQEVADSKASVSSSAKDRARIISWSRHWRRRPFLGDISPAPLAPADATAAFVKGSVDAWSIWDPYLALAELKENARVIAFDKDVHKSNAFYIAGSDFVDKHPSLVAKLNAIFATEGHGRTAIMTRLRGPRLRPRVLTSRRSNASSLLELPRHACR